MQVQVSGHHLDVGDALRTHVTERLEQSVGKYFDKPINGHVIFTKEGSEYRADCSVHLNSGMHINTQGRSHDPYASFDGAVDKLDKRLRRYKSRLKSHAKDKQALPVESARSFIIEASDEHEEVSVDAPPVIIAEGTTSIPRLSVGDAVMQMDLIDAKFVVFRNGATGGLNVVYRREDGNIGWIDAGIDSAKP
ncbi:ribosome-associated translation inhibitor RaiA [Parvibaculum sedimenti]|uniref:Ribosome hibernation promoting factor n=1 Tax=Parvibaculum sedimenti TaxID=2608632 RepID=A0A6N6VSX1_9HYPH|nr:ribosome-associated translation inhibitor RaiA [Parvibaculum sedimenti]KAB7742746.1 ribosome-associated translation inhibitor RaiA [Parvibaculum sedimenti]